jgi:hypothetical protein
VKRRPLHAPQPQHASQPASLGAAYWHEPPQSVSILPICTPLRPGSKDPERWHCCARHLSFHQFFPLSVLMSKQLEGGHPPALSA